MLKKTMPFSFIIFATPAGVFTSLPAGKGRQENAWFNVPVGKDTNRGGKESLYLSTY